MGGEQQVPNLFPRESYLSRIRPFYDSDLIKVITGIRRCGKSSLLLTIMDELRSRGVQDTHIVYLNLDSRRHRGIRDADALDEAVESLMPEGGMRYLFIDEVQNVPDYEVVVNGWREEGDVSVFITGSNSYLLSGELMTKLTGRYIEFEMYTLDFAEWLGMRRHFGLPEHSNGIEALEEYLTYSGFPKVLEFSTPDAKQAYVRDVVSQIIEKDIRKDNRGRVRVRNLDVFERILTYVVNNYGATTNAKNIADHFTNVEDFPLRRDTVKRYLDVMENAKLICKCTRFDLKTRRSLGAQEKYYLSDIGIYFARNTDNRIDYGPALENILYTYLRARGYQLSIGKIGKLECDFICRKNNGYAYIQVAASIVDRKVEDREYEPFHHIRDSYPRYVLTLDPLPLRREGVTHLNMVNFMVEGAELVEQRGSTQLRLRQRDGGPTDSSGGQSGGQNGGQSGGQNGGDAMTGSPADQRGDSVLKAISNNPRATAREIADDLGISKRTVERTIKALRECGLISRKGGARGAWQVKAE